ncbi:MAG: two-component regulator propeller domain-containing protein [Balneola sp.]
MRLFLLSVLILISIDIKAQNVSFKFKNYSLEEGLSQSTVYAFLEDDLGYLWIGTRDGLNRFDNNKFVTYYPSFDETNSLSNRSVRALVKDEEGFIWVGTDGGGVDRFNPKTSSFLNLCKLVTSEDCELKTNITSLDVSDNILLIGTRTNGLYKYNIDTKTLNKELDLSSTIWDIKSYKEVIILATSDGLIFWDSLVQTTYLKDQEVRALELLNESQLLIGSKNDGVYILDRTTEKLSRLNIKLSGVEISDIEFESGSNIWVATDSEGIFLANSKGEILQHFLPSKQGEFQLQSSSIRTLYEDSNGIIWIGTNNAGLSNFHQDRFQFQGYSNQSTNQELTSDVILSFNELDNGDILIGTEQSGLLRFNRTEESFTPIRAFEKESIIAIEKTENGQFWIATDGYGLKKIENQNQLNQTKKIKNLAGKSILSLEVDSENEVIAGAYQGFYIIKDYQVLKMNFIPEYLKTDRILAIELTSDNQVLLGTFANGLVLFNREDSSFKKIDPNNSDDLKSRSPERVQVIYTDKNNRIWLGSYSGLYKFDLKNESFEIFSSKDGLPSDVVYGILEDSAQNLWLSTNSGISKFNPEKKYFVNYTKSDGLLSNEFNGGAYFKDSNEKMYFGGVKGFTVFDPLKIEDEYLPGKIVVYEMNVDGEIYNTISGKYFRLKEGQDFIQFDFSYLNFLDSHKNKLEYRLNGLSENWIPVNKRRTINFSGLSSGDYNFQLRAVNSIGEVTVYSNSILFYIAPPLWRTWYFNLGVIFLLLFIVYSLFRYRMFYLLKDEQTRNRISKDLHDDLSGTLSSISFFSEAAKRDGPENSKDFLRKIDESAIEAKEKINDIIWAIDPSNDDWSFFLAKCKRYASEMFESKGISYEIELDESVTTLKNYRIRQDLWLVFKEMVTNVVRHSQANRTKVSLIKKDKKLILVVEDNGIGLSKDDQTKGSGISNLKYRAKKMNAFLASENIKPTGTRWKLEIKI